MGRGDGGGSVCRCSRASHSRLPSPPLESKRGWGVAGGGEGGGGGVLAFIYQVLYTVYSYTHPTLNINPFTIWKPIFGDNILGFSIGRVCGGLNLALTPKTHVTNSIPILLTARMVR